MVIFGRSVQPSGQRNSAIQFLLIPLFGFDRLGQTQNCHWKISKLWILKKNEVATQFYFGQDSIFIFWLLNSTKRSDFLIIKNINSFKQNDLF